MELDETIMKFKEGRLGLEKKPLNITINKLRIENILESIDKKHPLFRMLGPSERIDFLIYMLERFLVNAQIVPIQATINEIDKRDAEKAAAN